MSTPGSRSAQPAPSGPSPSLPPDTVASQAPPVRPATGQRVNRARGAMAVGTTLSRLTGFARVIVLTRVLGLATPVAGAYNLASTVPNSVFDLVAGGILGATLIPVFSQRLATRSEKQAWEDISAIVTLAAAVLAVATAIFVVLAPELISLFTLANHTTATASQRAIATSLLRLIAPQVAAYGMALLVGALLNIRGRFTGPAFAPIANNLVVIAVLLLLEQIVPHPGLQALATHRSALLLLGLGTSAGVVVQAFILLPSLLRSGVRLRPHWNPRNAAVRMTLRLSGWTFAITAANQVALLVVMALAFPLAHGGGIAVYTYAYTFFQLPFAVVVVSVMSPIQPSLAARWSVGDINGFRRRLASGIRATNAAIIPATFAYLVLAGPLMAMLTSNPSSIALAEHTLIMFAVGLPGFCLYQVVIQAFQSMRDVRTAFWLYVLKNSLNVGLAFLFVPSLGVSGLALSLSVSYTVAAAVGLLRLRQVTGGLEGRAILRTLTRSTVTSALGAAIMALVATNVGSDHGFALILRLGTALLLGGVALLIAAAIGARLSQRTPTRAQ